MDGRACQIDLDGDGRNETLTCSEDPTGGTVLPPAGEPQQQGNGSVQDGSEIQGVIPPETPGWEPPLG